MKNSILKKWVQMLAFLFVGWSVMASPPPGLSGSGTEVDPHRISGLADLQILSINSTYWASGKYFIQTADIDASATSTWNAGAGFSPIGNSTTQFQGNYDGGNFTIDGIFINSATSFAGMFGYVATAGVVNNLGVTNVNFTGQGYAGGLAAVSSGTINNCYSTGTVTTTSSEYYEGAGGLVGSNYGTISNSYSTCTVSGDDEIGGFVGINNTNATITKCYSNGSAVATGDNAGGFVGINISMGGNNEINNCYSLSNVQGVGSVGGFVGKNQMNMGNAYIKMCYSAGAVTGTTNVGGFVGSDWSDTDNILNCFFDADEDGLIGTISGTAEGISGGATGKTTAEMQDNATYPSASWIFPTTWTQNSTDNSGYPALEWQGFTHGDPAQPMQLVFTTTADNQSIELPLYGTVDCTVDWGDGTVTDVFTTTGNKPHTFAAAGTYTVEISGSLTQFGNGKNGWTGSEYLTEVVSFGDIGLTSLSGAFKNADNLSSVPADLPSSVTKLGYCFANSDKATISNLDIWDVGSVTEIYCMFSFATSFNQDIGSWDVSHVTDMSSTFEGASSFNQDISNWEVGSVQDMTYMFSSATSFNQNIGNWDISSVSDMDNMFENVTLSTANYDALLTDWAGQTVQSGVTFSGGNSQYSAGAAATARASLISDDNWTITDGGEAPVFSGGTGTQADPYQIETLDDLEFLSENSTFWATGTYFIQTADIDASDTRNWNVSGSDTLGFSPIGNNTNKFQGYYDGDEYTISNLYINRSTTDIIGLFGYTNGADISNIGVDSCNITGQNYVGGLVGWNYSSSISNSYSTGSVSGTDAVGGLVGLNSNSSSISKCYSTGSVSGNGAVGGLAGFNNVSSISNSYSTGSVSGTEAVGGLVGYNFSSISNCYSMGNVTRSSNTNTTFGGFGGSSSGTIEYCYSTGKVYSSAGTIWNEGGNKDKGFLGSDNFSTTLDNFFDATASEQTSGDGATAKTTAQMKTQDTFTNWDFATIPIWNIDANNDGYPYLAWQVFPDQPMQLVFTTTAANQSIALPLYGTVNCTVDWGDGSATEAFTTTGDKPHTFAAAGIYTVSISGSLTWFGKSSTEWTGVGYLTEVTSFGAIGLTSLSGAFRNADNLSSVPATLPSTVTNLSRCFFRNDKATITNLDLWDVSNVTDMQYLFCFATLFNQNIGSWNVGNVTNMEGVFYGAPVFDQNIGNWNVSHVTTMESMFSTASDFNQNISSWNVGSVTNMVDMFDEAFAFNQDISGWNVSNVTDMNMMFYGATSFNQNISNWDVSNVTNMSLMFDGATAFNQNLAGWDISSVTTMEEMFEDVTLSTTNYDALLIGWAAQTVQPNVEFHGGNSKYTCGLAAAARDSLAVAPNSWTIADGGQATDCPMQFEFTFTSTNGYIELPLYGTVSCNVNWGDGTAPENFTTEGDQGHTYASAGTYIVSISGSLTWFGSDNYWWEGVEENLIRVYSLGNLGLTSLEGAFCYSYELKSVPAELPATVTNLAHCFEGIQVDSIGYLNLWDVGNVTNMAGMFVSSDFNQDINDWNVERVKDMSEMFSCPFFNSDISNWAVDSVTNMTEMFYQNRVFNQDISIWNVENVTDMSKMFYDDQAFNQDISGWNVGNVNDMSGMFLQAYVFNQDIGGWNVSRVKNMKEMFQNADAFNQDISGWSVDSVTTMANMFAYADAFNQNIGSWNTGSVTRMSNMFEAAGAFNQNIGNWDVSHVTNMSGMFKNDTIFNQNIGGWDVSSVTTMSQMFYGNTAFNQDIGLWDVSSVTNMNAMFYGNTAFNQNIGNWDVANVTNMSSMFMGNTAFNQDISDWVVSAVSTMQNMFMNNTAFNQSIGTWAVSSVTSMQSMFEGNTAFNQEIGDWDVALVTTMSSMFKNNTIFNQDIGDWEVSNVTGMTEMFSGATAFNQNIGDWDVSKVTNMYGMFEGASAFNHDLGDWELNSSIFFNNMLKNCGMDCVSYSNTLMGWAENPNIPTGKTLGADGLTYGTDAAPYRTTLINTKGWTINGDNAGTSECLCTNPDDGGAIATAQTICKGSTPDSLTSTALPTGHTGELEYQWQYSTTSETTGFTSIANSDDAGYQPGTITATTWIKRLARVDCKDDWSGAAESNVVKITVQPLFVTTQAATAITATIATGNGDITSICSSEATNRGIVWYPYSDTDKIIGETDVTNVDETGNFTTGTFSASLTSLSANTRYNARAHATNTEGTEYGERVDFWTLANVPSAPTVNAPTTTSLDVAINANGNPAITEYAIYDTVTAMYVQPNGTLDADTAWMTEALWETNAGNTAKTVTGLSTNSRYTFKVKARNGDGIETDLGDPTSLYTLAVAPGATTVNAADTTSLHVAINANGNQVATGFAVYERKGNKYVQADGTLGAGAIWQTEALWETDATNTAKKVTGLIPNTEYTFLVKARNGDNVETDFGEADSLYTLANVPAPPSVINPTATSLDVAVNVNGNPDATEFAIQDSLNGTYVQANGTRAATAVWQTAADWNTITVTGLSTAVTYYFRVKAKNGDNVETAFGLATGQNTCSNPTNGGEIVGAATICYNTIPDPIESVSPATDFGGTLEYRWELATESPTVSTTWTEIPGTNSDTFSPEALSETTWYRRAARVDCKADWTGAVYSNTVKITIIPTSTLVVKVNITASKAPNGQVLFKATPVNGGANPTYIWLKNGVEIKGVTGDELISTCSSGDEHSVILFSSIPCTEHATSNAMCTY